LENNTNVNPEMRNLKQNMLREISVSRQQQFNKYTAAQAHEMTK
jgi:hypothetical protein